MVSLNSTLSSLAFICKIHYGLQWLMILPTEFRNRDFFYLIVVILYMDLLFLMVKISVNKSIYFVPQYTYYSPKYNTNATMTIRCSLNTVYFISQNFFVLRVHTTRYVQLNQYALEPLVWWCHQQIHSFICYTLNIQGLKKEVCFKIK